MSCEGLGEFGDFEKDISWDWNLGDASPAWGYGMRGAFVRSVSWDFDSGPGSPAGSWLKNNVETVSIIKIVSLFPHVEKLNSSS